ncbi:hypothetical protein [Nocardia barduliensis]|uniref:hypothetical protein n=1 Tax=Nocardia barduliensis TaxID=2736643 RepID=UPI001572A966|nr:hypothetical protein [Nocardia barduliensis]
MRSLDAEGEECRRAAMGSASKLVKPLHFGCLEAARRKEIHEQAADRADLRAVDAAPADPRIPDDIARLMPISTEWKLVE